MSAPNLYDMTELEQIAVNLFHGWGYNFYRLENLLRADDLMTRSKTGWLLGLARRSLEMAEADYRREFLPPPSRQKPRHDPHALTQARLLEHLSRAIGALEGQIRAQPVPENDRMTQYYREEAPTLLRLQEADRRLVGRAELLRGMLEGKDANWILANAARVTEALDGLAATLTDRQAILMV